MSKAYKCDICGDYYESERRERVLRVELEGGTALAVVRLFKDVPPNEAGSRPALDACPTCTDKALALAYQAATGVTP